MAFWLSNYYILHMAGQTICFSDLVMGYVCTVIIV